MCDLRKPPVSSVDIKIDGVKYDLVLPAAISPIAARTMYRRARAVNHIDSDLAEYVRRHAGYFHECGGFDLLRIRYYFDKKDRYYTLLDIEDTEPEKLLRL